MSTNENMVGSEEKNPSTKTNATRLSNAVYRHGILVQNLILKACALCLT